MTVKSLLQLCIYRPSSVIVAELCIGANCADLDLKLKFIFDLLILGELLTWLDATPESIGVKDFIRAHPPGSTRIAAVTASSAPTDLPTSLFADQ